CVDIVWKLLVHQGGLPAGIHGLFSEWYCGLASRITLGVSMAWDKVVTTGTLYALSLDKLAMSYHFYKKFRMGVAIAKGCRGYYEPGTRAWVRQGSRKIRKKIAMYPCRVEERLTIELVEGREVDKVSTMCNKERCDTRYAREVPEYQLTEERRITRMKIYLGTSEYEVSYDMIPILNPRQGCA
ncbi:hypothetical protein Tco_1420963, partial [Tanacetum coccineum]